jgi:ligand-binding sensor domain-containing protein/signal transduction histidine kinase
VRADGHVVCWRAGRQVFDTPAGLWGEPSQKNICQDKYQVIWFTTASDKLVRVRGSNAPVTVGFEAPLRGKNWNAVAADVAGGIWAGSDQELATFQNGRLTIFPVPTNQRPFNVEQLIPAASGAMWAAANHRLWLLEKSGAAKDICAWPPLGVPSKVYLSDHEGRLWLGTRGHGLIYIEPDGRQNLLTADDGLSGNYVSSLFEDRENNIWVGMDRTGLARLRERRFSVLGPKQGLSVPVTWAVCEDPAGRIWLGTEGGGVNLWSGGRITRYDVGWENSPGEVRSLLADSTGIWVGTSYKGLYRLEDGKLSVPVDMRQIGYQVFAMCEYPSNQLWIGNQTGLFRWDRRTNVIKTYGEADGLTNVNVRAIVTDRQGRLWVGTYGGGVALLKGDRFEMHSLPSTTGGNNVSGLFPDADGSLWIATIGGGLCHLNRDKMEIFTTVQGLPDDRISYVISDDNGFLWMGSPGGVFRVSKASLAALAGGLTNRLDCLAFDKFDGLPTKVCTGGSQPACWRTHAGNLWFTTDNGAVCFNPHRFEINKVRPPLLIQEVRADARVVATLGGFRETGQSTLETGGAESSPEMIQADLPLKIEPGRHVLEFQYTGNSLTAPEKVQFKCRLEHVDRGWREMLNSRTATYYDVPPGDYKFRVIACNNDGVWNEEGATMQLAVLPYFWQTWWFKSLLVVAVLLVVGAVIHLRLMRLRNFARLRLRISRDIHDDIGCNLGSIVILTQILKSEQERQGHASADVLEIERITKSTVESLHDIVWFLNPDYDDLYGLVSKMREVAETILRGLQWEFKEEGASGNDQIPLAFRQNVLPLFKEILNNIVKHSHAAKVDIQLEVRQPLFRLVVADDGRGFDVERERKGSGLKNLAWRSEVMKGKIDIQSRPGAGTTIIFESAIQPTRDRL